MFNFENANKKQIEAIQSTEGPVLIIAGPGTGKTYTLVERTIYLIAEKGVKPENIMIATFTEKAAKEIITRITNELDKLDIYVNINEMYIGTFHSICLRILKENIDYSNLKKNYRMIDEFEQQYLIYQNISKFKKIKNFSLLHHTYISNWRLSQYISDYTNNISEELVDVNQLINDDNQEIAAIGEIIKLYNNILLTFNYIDFSHIQTETYELLKENPNVLENLNKKIKYIMIDEYQDTNYVQEQLAFMLAGKQQNICVVGDDDQGLYRFRGATIRNLLEFPDKFGENVCKKIKLEINYRSEKDIIDFYNKWMQATESETFSFKWDKYRFDKKIITGREDTTEVPTVMKISAQDNDEIWRYEILNFIKELKKKNIINNYNQIAMLFNSVRGEKAIKLAYFLESNGVNVYSPRSKMFFERKEIKELIGTLLLLFPQYSEKMKNRSFDMKFEKILESYEQLFEYYEECIKMVGEYIHKDEQLKLFIRNFGISHMNLFKNTDYAFAGLLYKIFEFQPFREYMSIDLNNGLIDQRPIRNISIFTQMIARFDYLQHIDVFTPKNIVKDVETFFNTYLRFLIDGGMGEYEDETEYAPSGCITFSTIHQSKGMEFPIVIVDSLENAPRDRNNAKLDEIEEKYYHRKSFEPKKNIKYFDFWRLYYTAFSRAQNILVLTCNETTTGRRQPSEYFKKMYEKLPCYTDESIELSKVKISDIKPVNIKNTYSFTSHISVYENCALQYKFLKELGFSPVRVGATIFGQLIHQTIEDIHKTAIRKEYEKINRENIKIWFDTNYESISKSQHSYLGKPQLDVALEQVIRYAEKQSDNWKKVQDAEVEIGLVKPNYILNGVVDLIEGNQQTVEIVDFKSEKKPDIFTDPEKFEKYKRQLQIYAYLIEKKTGKKVSKMHLYYTGEKNGVPTITFENKKEDIDETIKEFDKIVNKIECKEFNQKSKSQKICDNCDLRFFCKK